MESDIGLHYIGIDVGTGSARACVIDYQGNIVGLASQSIKTWQPHPEFYEQSTADIWSSICTVVKQAIQEGDVPPSSIQGLAFDATCSLAVFNKETNSPVSVSGSGGSGDQNVILWLDHRAVAETKTINATGHPVLQYVGGGMSVEMEMPKILWLKNHMDASKFRDCEFYDLADALTHLATGEKARSYCSVICKQGYLPAGTDYGEEGWQLDFLKQIGLGDLATDNYSQIGGINGKNGQYLSAGQRVGPLSEKAAMELGLSPGIAVGSGVIDAYAGWIGTVGAKVDLGLDGAIDDREHVSHRLALVAGTSTCHLAMTNNELFVPGIWGPYRDVLFSGAYVVEGGQSATGELIRHVVESHPAYSTVATEAKNAGISIYDFLNDYLREEAKHSGYAHVSELAKHFFFYGDLWGNRSPIADPQMSGAVIGLRSDASTKSLALHYYGVLEFIALQTRQIVDTMNEHGYQISTIFMSGSQTLNDLLVRLIASCCKMPVIVPKYVHAAVCHGTAMLAAMAASEGSGKESKDLWSIMSQMSKPGRRVDPTADANEQRLLQAKYEVFLDMCFKQREYRDLIDKRISAVE
ncbi:hypothetical protein N7517_006081 [Penicillium concentricum]|uniref:Carbohydrate kinase FGGY C-terminal domain-containing protein n=1 Tax=Penicillium concentricum TaxID=293559 RepID=A0A9W9S932_9EURO|nr:uncharacterized protein N7517_006081 [Penicillium concentricum]KAJ5374075.1 hypothetical protein N7517_006081 [Penicillium concentricum]